MIGYQHRPQTIQSMCLVEFGVTYATDYRCDDDSDVLPLTEPEATSSQLH